VHLVAPSRYLVENLSDNLQVRIVPGLAHDVLRQVAFFLECHMPRFMHPSSVSGCTFTFVETLPDSPSTMALDPTNLGGLPPNVLSVLAKGHGARIGYMMIGRLQAARSLAVTLALLRSGEFSHLVSAAVAQAQWGLIGGANSPHAPAVHDDAFWEQLYGGGEGRIRRGLLTGWDALGRSPIGPNRVRTWVQWVGDRLRPSFGLGAGVLPPGHVMDAFCTSPHSSDLPALLGMWPNNSLLPADVFALDIFLHAVVAGVGRHVNDLLSWWASFSVLNVPASWVVLETSFDVVRTYLEGLGLLQPGAPISGTRFPLRLNPAAAAAAAASSRDLT